MDPDGLSIVIPVYNERHGLDDLPGRLEELRQGAETPLEFILVDDGSDDGSGEALADMTGPDIKLVRHPENRGYGAALKSGIARASHPWVAIIDADGTYPFPRILDLFARARAEDLDMMVGARVGAEARIPWLRRPPKWVLRRLAAALSGRPIPDLNSGLRVMKKAQVERFVRLLPDGFSFTTTITLAMLSSGLRVEFTPITYAVRLGRSKIRPFYDTLNFLQLIIRVVLWFNPLRIFLPLSGVCFLLAFLVLLGSWAFLERAMDVTFAVLAITGVIVLAIGMLADLIDKRMG